MVVFKCFTCQEEFEYEQILREHERLICPGRRKVERPPIGIMPRYLWEEERFQQLHAAIKRYAEASIKINPAWIEEYNELHGKIESRWRSGRQD